MISVFSVKFAFNNEVTEDEKKKTKPLTGIPSAPLFLRKLVLGIPAQASGKNHVAINAFGAPIRPAFVSLRHIIASSMLTP